MRAVEDPPLFAAHGFEESLGRVGIRVAEPPRKGIAPAESVLLHSQHSKPLALLLHDMNKQSSNVFAETLLQVLGAELAGLPGTREKGLAVMEAFLDHGGYAFSGLPDLVVLPGPDITVDGLFPARLGPELHLVEVKGPGDSVRDEQAIWFDRLVDAGVSVELWRVQAL